MARNFHNYFINNCRNKSAVTMAH